MDTLIFFVGALACAALVFFVVRRQGNGRNGDIVVGGIYASQQEDGRFGVVKVLAVDNETVHVKMYRDKFDKLPRDLDPKKLTLGRLGDPEGFGIAHAPFARDGWLDKETLVARDKVREEELDGYRYHQEARREGM